MPVRHIHLDFETFSLADLPAVGAYRYAFDPSTEILCAAMAMDGNEPFVWQLGMSDDDVCEFEYYQNALEDPEILIYCHNAQFEMAICQALLEKTWGIKCPDLSRFRCTMSFARRAALPGSLEKLAEVLGLSAQKDKEGSALMKKFSFLQPERVVKAKKGKKPTKKNPLGVPDTPEQVVPEHRIYPKDDPEAFARYMEYCAQDVRTEQQVAKKLAYFDEPINNGNYSLDAVINARGVPVNLDALRHANTLVEEEKRVVSAKFRAMTGLDPTQREKILNWLNARGAGLPNLQAATVEEFLDRRADEIETNPMVQALYLRSSIEFAAVKKIPSMLASAGPHDNRIRGMLNHHGAVTGRWSQSIVQFHNMKRPSAEMSAKVSKDSDETVGEAAYRDICKGMCLEMIRFLYGPPLEVISSCIRHFVHDVEPVETEYGIEWDNYEETPFLNADYSAIEARLVAWLAGQEDSLEEYRAYDAAETKEEKHALDPYRILAALIFSIPVGKVEKVPHRLVGKHAKLGCGYQMWIEMFIETVWNQGKYRISYELAEKAVLAYREKHDKIVAYWYEVDRCMKKAVLNKDILITSPKIPRGVCFKHIDIEGIPYLLVKLPSGRKLSYPWPKLIPSTRTKDRLQVEYFGHIKEKHWGRIAIRNGGQVVARITQGTAADVMANGLHNAEKAGYETATTIHDEALTYYDRSKGQTVKEHEQCLVDLPPWGDGLPIAIEGGFVPFYKKD